MRPPRGEASSVDDVNPVVEPSTSPRSPMAGSRLPDTKTRPRGRTSQPREAGRSPGESELPSLPAAPSGPATVLQKLDNLQHRSYRPDSVNPVLVQQLPTCSLGVPQLAFERTERCRQGFSSHAIRKEVASPALCNRTFLVKTCSDTGTKFQRNSSTELGLIVATGAKAAVAQLQPHDSSGNLHLSPGNRRKSWSAV